MSSPFHPRLSLVTLGVADLAVSRRFYEALGLTRSSASQDAIAFYQLNGLALALFSRHALAEDAGVADAPREPTTFPGFTLAQNVGSPAEVDAVIAFAVAAGGRLVKAGQAVFWGGYSGYVADPDGYLWEVAHNPFITLDEAGNLVLP